mmetsp:Transcript_71791/g.126757  ORF Transcript_71791/g.126757 Transcript_71791/m.126757 type:complete len:569 (+) Transcript_71791:54-1760(+)
MENGSRIQAIRLRKLFQRLDKDGNGRISRDELKVVFERLSGGSADWSEEDFDATMAAADLDSDGTLDLDEFCNWVFATKDASGQNVMTQMSRKRVEEKAKKRHRVRHEKEEKSAAVPDTSKYVFTDIPFSGAYSYSGDVEPEFEEVAGAIDEGIDRMKGDPNTYAGGFYQTNMVEWPVDQQHYKLVKRSPAKFSVQEDPEGAFLYVQVTYEALPREVEVVPDDYTDSMSFAEGALAEPLMPGRGQGVADVPGLTILGDTDPGDVRQGQVGDCWLLSALSALAEFDGAIAKLFKNTPSVESLPGNDFNHYTVTLNDITTWTPVDVVVDERLCAKDNNSLLGCASSKTGELWACYLEKAIAAHCGGWNEIHGGTCTHAWMLLTGCQEQYTIRDQGEGFVCWGGRHPATGELSVENSPHKSSQVLYNQPWPEVGGGGGNSLKLTSDELFERMCQWDDANYLLCAGSHGHDDTQSTDGIVDGHAYSILDCINNVAGTDFDLIKLRNPWGKELFTSGMWADGGSGWEEHPEIKEACNHIIANDGVFYLEKAEFFQYFNTVFLCAHDMACFLEA